jgi:hypothetical protein
MEKVQALHLLKTALAEIADHKGAAKVDEFSGLREVDAKVREVRMILEGVGGLPSSLLDSMSSDLDFQANSRRVRLEALAGYVKSALKFVDTGAFQKPKKQIHSPPDLSILTSSVPGLKDEIDKRWKEAQKCVHVAAYTSAIILMGSILEGLLLARAQLSVSIAYQSPHAPKGKDGKPIALQSWNLNALIEVSADVGWIKTDRGKFSHALRDSRNVVHPWHAVLNRANFDESTCKTSWSVLDASVGDLLKSLQNVS